MATVAAVPLLAAVAGAGGTSPRPVIAYTQLRTLAQGEQLYVTVPVARMRSGKARTRRSRPTGGWSRAVLLGAAARP